jgi:tetratricopeptide (TPR) repeat protein
LHVKLNDLQLMFDRNPRTQNAAAGTGKDYSPQLEKLSKSVEELRELMMMPEEDRQRRGEHTRHQGKMDRVKEVFAMVAAHEWAKAEKLLSLLEIEFPGDAEVVRGRTYLDHSRRLFEDETVVRASREVEDLVNRGKWEEARYKSEELIQGFPMNGDAQLLKQRVEREFQSYRETTVRNMIDHIRAAVQRRTWHEALEQAEQLVALFPDHPLSDQVRAQIPTLLANIEIDERQAIEVRIQELIRDGRIEQAIELAEDTIRRYPNSPQAESLEKLLPRLRDLNTQGPNEFAHFSREAVTPFHTQGKIDAQDTVE